MIALCVFLTAFSAFSLFQTDVKLKAASVVFVCLAFVWMLFRSNGDNISVSFQFASRYSIFIVGIMVFTLVIYLVNFESSQTIIRGFEKMGFLFIVVAVVFFSALLFGEKSIAITYDGLLLSYVLCTAYALKLTGPSRAIADMQTFITSGGEAYGFMKYLEMADATFSFTLFLIYFLFFEEKGHAKRFHVISCIILCVVGYKRIGVAADVVAIVLYFLLKNLSFEQLKRACRVIGISFLVFGFVYVIAVYNDWFTLIMAKLNIDTMGRNDLYDMIRPYYQISPTFLGRGYEFITEFMVAEKSRIGAIHNGYLAQFVEMGFWGFFMWEGFWLVYLPHFFAKFGKRVLLAGFLVTICAFTTYMTDNTAFYFYTGTALRLIPCAMACSCGCLPGKSLSGRMKGVAESNEKISF